jgi:hypothetical protein
MKAISVNTARALPICFAILALAACGGGGGSDSSDSSASGSGGGETSVASPSALSYTSPVQATVSTAITPLSPTVTGIVSSYSVSPVLPSGLSLNTTSGVISGTPTASAAQTTYTITATNSSGSTTFNLSLIVNALTVNQAAPSALSYTSPVQATVGTPITSLSPAVTGTVSDYSVNPVLPSGLSLNTTSGLISGTPTATAAQATYTITATNSSGSATFGLALTVNPATPAVPAISVSSASLTFSSQATGTTSTARSITVTNTGTGSLSISGAIIGGANSTSFADTNGCAASLAANATCTISVTFSPSGQGSLNGALSIVSNASSSPTAVSLTGTGVAPPTVTLTADPVIAQAGQPTTLTWSSSGATACSAAGSWSGSQPTSGASAVTSSSTPGYYTYTINCTGYGATASQSVIFTAYGNTPITQSGNIIFYRAAIEVPTPNQIIGFQTTTVAPPLPASSSISGAYIAYWPGLEPLTNSVNYLPTNGGVLQPALLFVGAVSTGWGANSSYYNSNGIPPIVEGAMGNSAAVGDDNFNNPGDPNGFTVLPGDVVAEDMVLDQTTGYWTVNLTDTTSNQSNTLVINMQGQGQNYALFAMEIGYGLPVTNPVIFTNSTLTFASPDTTGICTSSGPSNNYVTTPPTLDSTGTKCSIAEVILYQN